MYGDSHALFSDPSPIFPSNFKQEQDHPLPFMESDYRQQFDSSQNSSGLLRFRSAPTSLLENLMENSSKLGFSRFCCGETNGMNVAEDDEDDDGGNEGSGSRFDATSLQLPPRYPRQRITQMGDDIVVSSIGSNLMRQNSSPAGLLSHLNSQTGYSGARVIGSSRVGNGDLGPSSSRFSNDTSFSPVTPSLLSQISEVENENGGPNDLLFTSSGFPFGSWNDSSCFAESISSGIKREVDNNPKMFMNNERLDTGFRPNMLSRHLSLPVEKLRQLQDSVPCKVRAKRGCATHPRSIAERIRRNRISERMRKLQELVPNMDKQTNTADMLDLAVEYIKGLQKQIKILNEIRTKCKCSAFLKC